MNENPYQTPVGASEAANLPAPPMSILQLLFSFKGRINRAKYWLAIVVTMVVFVIVISVAAGIATPFILKAADEARAAAGEDISRNGEYNVGTEVAADASVPDPSFPVAFFLVILILFIPLIWVAFAIRAKRWHDRDKSGWMSLVLFILVVGPLWALIENGFLEGTSGPNKYGNDPLA